MKTFTKYLKDEQDKDLRRFRIHNNTKEAKRTPEQNEQHKNDRVSFYNTKWSKLLNESQTPAQKRICLNMLSLLYIIR